MRGIGIVEQNLCLAYIMLNKTYSCKDHFLAQFRDIFAYLCMKSHTNSRSEKKNRTSNLSHFTPQILFFAHAVHFETFRLFYVIGFWIIFAPLFVSYTIAGSQSLRSVSLVRFTKIFVKIICRSLVFFLREFLRHFIECKKQVKISLHMIKENCPSHDVQ